MTVMFVSGSGFTAAGSCAGAFAGVPGLPSSSIDMMSSKSKDRFLFGGAALESGILNPPEVTYSLCSNAINLLEQLVFAEAHGGHCSKKAPLGHDRNNTAESETAKFLRARELFPKKFP